VLFQLETEKNRLEMLLNNNLLKKLEQLQQELQEMKGEDRKQKMEMLETELKSVGERLSYIYGQFSGTLHILPAYSTVDDPGRALSSVYDVCADL